MKFGFKYQLSFSLMNRNLVPLMVKLLQESIQVYAQILTNFLRFLGLVSSHDHKTIVNDQVVNGLYESVKI